MSLAVAPAQSSSDESDGDDVATLIPRSRPNDVYGYAGLNRSDLKLLKVASKALGSMTSANFKIISTISGVDARYALEAVEDEAVSDDSSDDKDSASADPSDDEDPKSDDSSDSEDSESDDDQSQAEAGNDRRVEVRGNNGGVGRDIVFYGPDNIPRSVRDGEITKVMEIELWLYGGALTNINGIFIKPRGFDKPFVISAGKGAAVDRSCFVELMTPMCGDPVGEMTVKPRRGGYKLTRFRKGQCFARILCFDDRLGL